MQIGQILVEQRWVAPAALARVLTEQREQRGKRICSLLIARGLLDPDNAARGLATQHNVPGVLQRHLENRDPALAALLAPAVARACAALPIGRTRTGELIVCVRDPSPGVRGALATAIPGPIVVAVAPATQLEQLIERVYAADGPSGEDGESFDVDLSTRPIAIMSPDELAKIGVLGDLGSMTLVGLDDAGVAKDPTQSGQLATLLPRTMTTPGLPGVPGGPSTPPARPTPPPARSAPVPRPPLPSRTRTQPWRPAQGQPGYQGQPGQPGQPGEPGQPDPSRSSARSLPRMPFRLVTPPAIEPEPALADAIAAIGFATTADDAAAEAMQYLAAQFHYAVLFAVSEGAALGDRGHGDALTTELVQAISIPLSAPSVVQVAHDSRQMVAATRGEAGIIQDRLTRTLGSPEICLAIPVEASDRIAWIIAVGDRIDHPETPPGDLAQLARALGAAYERLEPGSRPR
jgi:hypothetical protein